MTVSQFGALLIVLASKTEKNFFNSGDLVVCSVVELSGLFLCLLGAARITHEAQGIASLATRWHMLVISASASGSNRPKPKIVEHDGSHSDTDSDLLIPVSTFSDSSSFQIQQALVAYLERNNGGITLYGFVLDRGRGHPRQIWQGLACKPSPTAGKGSVVLNHYRRWASSPRWPLAGK